MEIEKKYKIKYLPKDYDKEKALDMEQGYLCTRPTVRIRKQSFLNSNNDMTDEYILTLKSKTKESMSIDPSICANNEIEIPLDKEAYTHLKEKVDRNMVAKTRYKIPLADNLVAELDIFKGILDGLMFVEVEFDSEEQALCFVPPDWFGKDVSSDYRYKNVYLSSITDRKYLEELL